MRRSAIVFALLSPVALAACAEHGEIAAAAHPNLIVVREFSAPSEVVTLDPTLGYSLRRGEQGVPASRRAASVARAAAFTIADTITQELRQLGYDAVRSEQAASDPGARAIIVSGTFRSIDEGHRLRAAQQDAGAAADVEIDYQAAGGQVQRVMAFPLDSRRLQGEGLVSAAVRREPLKVAEERLGAAIARTVAEVARRSNWPGAPH